MSVRTRGRGSRPGVGDEAEVALAVYVCRIAFRIRDEPDWSGRCACSQTVRHSAIAAITGWRKSFGCGL